MITRTGILCLALAILPTCGDGSGGGGSVPSGTVRFCVGSCPFGECDETMALVDVPCSSFYPEPASATTVYCIPGDSGAYCLETDDGGLRTWGITCQDGAPSFKECTAPCVANSAGHLDSC